MVTDEFYSLGFLLSRASVSLARALTAEFRKEGIDLPHSQFVVLRCLYYRDGISQSEIANTLFKDAAAIKRTLDNLESKGYVRRQAVRNLKNNVFITESGKSVMPGLLRVSEKVIAGSLDGIDAAGYGLLRELLEKIYSNTHRK